MPRQKSTDPIATVNDFVAAAETSSGTTSDSQDTLLAINALLKQIDAVNKLIERDLQKIEWSVGEANRGQPVGVDHGLNAFLRCTHAGLFETAYAIRETVKRELNELRVTDSPFNVIEVR
jgi:hypothetical protein